MKFNLSPKYWTNYLYNLARGSGDRTKGLILGSGMMAISNVISVITRVGLISLLTRIYTKDQFGLWISITSITALMTNSDFGIGVALRNELVKYRIEKNGDNDAREYFFSVVYFFLAFTIIISLLLFFFRDYIPYEHLFKTNNPSLKAEGRNILLWVPTLLLMSMPLGIGPMMFFAYQETKIAALHSIISCILGSLVITLAALLHQSVTVTSILYFLINLLCLTTATLYFIHRRKWHSWYVNIKLIMPRVWILLTQGITFSIMQISGAFLFNFTTVVSTSQIGLAAASELNVVQKLYALGLGTYLSFFNPLWAGFADAINRNDWNWCRTTILRSFYITIPLFLAAALVFTFYGNYFLKIFAGRNYLSSKLLLLSMGIWTLFYLLYLILTAFLSATGRIKIIAFLSVLCVFFLFQIAPYVAHNYGNIGLTTISSIVFFLLASAAYTESFYIINRNNYHNSKKQVKENDNTHKMNKDKIVEVIQR